MRSPNRLWVLEANVLLFCAAVVLGALFFVELSDGWSDAGGTRPGSSATDDPSSGGSRRRGDGPVVAPPVQIRVRSPEAAPHLTNDSVGPLFVETNMAPGATSTRCVAVTNIGSQLADIRMFADLADKGLGPHVAFTIETRHGKHGDCATFAGKEVFRGSLADFASAHRDFATGIPALKRVHPDDSVSFRMTQELTESSPQGGEAVARFGWEAHGAGAASPLDGRDPILGLASVRSREEPEPEGRLSILRIIFEVVIVVVKKGWSWIALFGLVIAFLVIQDRIDRRDPRLAGARVRPERDLPFNDRLNRTTRIAEEDV